MIRKASALIRASLVMTALLGGAVLIGGCGNSDSTDTGMPVATAPATPVSTPAPAAAPAKMKFDQLTLESAVARKTDSNGLVFFSFSYSDRDGKVYKCNLPEAMAQGEFSTDGWIRTFNLYREPEVIKQKKITADKNNDGLNDFPFIAPKAATPATTQPGASGSVPPPPPSPSYPGAPASSNYASPPGP